MFALPIVVWYRCCDPVDRPDDQLRLQVRGDVDGVVYPALHIYGAERDQGGSYVREVPDALHQRDHGTFELIPATISS